MTDRIDYTAMDRHDLWETASDLRDRLDRNRRSLAMNARIFGGATLFAVGGTAKMANASYAIVEQLPNLTTGNVATSVLYGAFGLVMTSLGATGAVIATLERAQLPAEVAVDQTQLAIMDAALDYQRTAQPE